MVLVVRIVHANRTLNQVNNDEDGLKRWDKL